MARKRLMIALLTGVAINYLVSWICLSWLPFTDEGYHRHPSRYPASDFGPLFYDGCTYRMGFGKTIHIFEYHRDNDIQTSGSANTPLPVLRAGWPMHSVLSELRLVIDDTVLPSLRGSYWIYDDSWSAAVARGLPSGRIGSYLGLHPWLPIIPLWPGFLVNTLSYSAVAWSVLASHIRRTRRIKQGLCIRCKYSLAGLETCPECNTPASQKAPPT
jgi:hypothetical protein